MKSSVLSSVLLGTRLIFDYLSPYFLQTTMMQTSFRLSAPFAPISTPPTPRLLVARAVKRSTGVTVSDVKNADGGRMVVEVDGQKVLLAAVGEEVCAVSNKCAHMGISLVGKTALLQARIAPIYALLSDLDSSLSVAVS